MIRPDLDSMVEPLLAQMEAVSQDAVGLSARLRGDQFNWSPDGRPWSVGHSIEHLSITTDRYLPVLDEAIASLHRQGRWVRRSDCDPVSRPESDPPEGRSFCDGRAPAGAHPASFPRRFRMR